MCVLSTYYVLGTMVVNSLVEIRHNLALKELLASGEIIQQQ